MIKIVILLTQMHLSNNKYEKIVYVCDNFGLDMGDRQHSKKCPPKIKKAITNVMYRNINL